MKKILPLLLLILIGCSNSEPIEYKNLVVREDGLHYEIGKNRPYSGSVINIDLEIDHVWNPGTLGIGFWEKFKKSEGSMKKGLFVGEVSYYSFFPPHDLKLKVGYENGEKKYFRRIQKGMKFPKEPYRKKWFLSNEQEKTHTPNYTP